MQSESLAVVDNNDTYFYSFLDAIFRRYKTPYGHVWVFVPRRNTEQGVWDDICLFVFEQLPEGSFEVYAPYDISYGTKNKYPALLNFYQSDNKSVLCKEQYEMYSEMILQISKYYKHQCSDTYRNMQDMMRTIISMPVIEPH